ncbi:hypothetical protein ALP40_01000 [Pseudomonas viridiflava]|uniref:DUF4123 domain-containing protein n=1 Tax=Pseudomonas viridiflava TaxID=33069 RepID=A0A3M5P775_PSEVI|nr:hypothetical protein ALP40_01000 [Pseudomonas viridiflava]
MTASFLLERTDTVLEKLYQLLPDPSPSVLFDTTELEPYREKSPLWLAASASGSLLQAVHNTPEDWPGLIIESPAPPPILLAHLRHLLIVRFDDARRGVLRYWSPLTASYFFTAHAAEDNAPWLGPITRLSWYGGTWTDLAHNTQRWNSLDNPHASQWTPAIQLATSRLSDTQEDAFRRQERERFAYDWWKRQTGCAFIDALTYLDEGMAHGFATDPALMSRYLSLRTQHPAQEAPPRQHTGTGEERLNTLQHLLQHSPHAKECAP